MNLEDSVRKVDIREKLRITSFGFDSKKSLILVGPLVRLAGSPAQRNGRKGRCGVMVACFLELGSIKLVEGLEQRVAGRTERTVGDGATVSDQRNIRAERTCFPLRAKNHSYCQPRDHGERLAGNACEPSASVSRERMTKPRSTKPPSSLSAVISGNAFADGCDGCGLEHPRQRKDTRPITEIKSFVCTGHIKIRLTP